MYPFLGVAIADVVVGVMIVILFATGVMNVPKVDLVPDESARSSAEMKELYE